MTGSEIGITAQILGALIDKLGPTPLLLFLAVVPLAPWAATIWMTRKQLESQTKVFARQDKRFEDVVSMYERNVELVKSHEKINEHLQELIMVTTSTLQTLVEHIRNNLYCPLVRQKTRPPRIEEEKTNHEQS